MTEVASPERLLFASTTQSFLEKEASLSRLRELHAAGTSFERDWWRRAAELGWASLLVPEELGGGSVSGDGVADLALVAELIGQDRGAGSAASGQHRAGRTASRHPKITRTQSNRWCPAKSSRPGRSTSRASRGHRWTPV